MSRPNTQPNSLLEDKSESGWAWLAKAWVLGYLLPGLVGLVFMSYHHVENRAGEAKKRQQQLNKQLERIGPIIVDIEENKALIELLDLKNVENDERGDAERGGHRRNENGQANNTPAAKFGFAESP